MLRLAQGDPHAATAALAPVLDGCAPLIRPSWLVEGLLLEAIAQPDSVLLPFLLHPVAGPLERHARHGSAHLALIAQILGLLAGETPAPRAAGPQPLLDPVSKSELRVLRYLPTHLTAQEIAGELYVSANTVKTQMRTLYAKLGAHSRAEAVDRARAIGLLASLPPTACWAASA